MKYVSVEVVIEQLIRALDSKTMRNKYLIKALEVNIMEAVLEDKRKGNLDNAEAGEMLAKFVHTPTYDNRTGSGPCKFTNNQQEIHCGQPLPMHWSNLYSSWNLAFVCGFPGFVYYMPKLLIPSVSDYQNNPSEYMYSRVLALSKRPRTIFWNTLCPK